MHCLYHITAIFTSSRYLFRFDIVAVTSALDVTALTSLFCQTCDGVEEFVYWHECAWLDESS